MWWRAHDEALDDPKLQRLPPELFKAWFNLMCLASRNEGALPALPDAAFGLRVSEAKAAETITQLARAGLLDKTETGFAPHNWNARQFKSDVSTNRVQRFRERRSKQEGNVSGNAPETEQRQSRAEPEQKTEIAVVVPKTGPTPLRSIAGFEGWWKSYPRTPVMSKKEAIAAWQRLSEPDRLAAVAALPKYAAFLKSKPDHPTVHACRFLSQRRFDGFEEAAEVKALEPIGFYAADGSEELEAWDAWWRRAKNIRAPRDNHFGWRFETQWPPGHEVKNGTGTQHGTQGTAPGIGGAFRGTSGAQAEAAGISGREGAAADRRPDGDGRAAAPPGPARGFTIE